MFAFEVEFIKVIVVVLNGKKCNFTKNKIPRFDENKNSRRVAINFIDSRAALTSYSRDVQNETK